MRDPRKLKACIPSEQTRGQRVEMAGIFPAV
jgi:hypothetical protein